MAYSQIERPLAVTSPLGEDVLLLKSLRGREELGRGFRFELELLSEDHGLALADLVGRPLSVSLERPGGCRFFHGLVASFEHAVAPGELSLYRATLVPWTWALTRSSDCRIFQQLSVPEIVLQVFRAHGFGDFELALFGEYAPREYCVQYRESDYDFVQRLLEEEGIYSFFRHEAEKHVLVLADSLSSHLGEETPETLPFLPPSESQHRVEAIWEWSVRRELQPGQVSLTAYDFKAPRKDLEVRSALDRGHALSDLELYDHVGNYAAHAVGEAQARLRLEEAQTRHETICGLSNARGIAAGALFRLGRTPREDQEREYLVTAAEVELHANEYRSAASALTAGEEEFRVRFEAVPSKEPFRPQRLTPKPLIQGPQTAIVVGAEGEEIWTDELGRIKVQFHWDRARLGNERSSCWLRVAQPWAGRGWGAISIPRIGQEVVVEFLEGDPDRPLVTGSVYNGANRPPFELPDNATVSGIKSSSSKDAQGFNELRFEDKAGKEEIYLHAERDLDILVKKDERHHVKGERHHVVEKDHREELRLNRHVTVEKSHFERIGGDRSLIVRGKEAKKVVGSITLQAEGNVIERFSASHSEDCGGSYALSAAKINLSCGGSSIEISPAGITIMTPGSITLQSGAAASLSAGGALAVSAATASIAAGALSLDSPAVNAAGVVNCQTLVTPSVVAASYTPGVGNLL